MSTIIETVEFIIILFLCFVSISSKKRAIIRIYSRALFKVIIYSLSESIKSILKFILPQITKNNKSLWSFIFSVGINFIVSAFYIYYNSSKMNDPIYGKFYYFIFVVIPAVSAYLGSQTANYILIFEYKLFKEENKKSTVISEEAILENDQNLQQRIDDFYKEKYTF